MGSLIARAQKGLFRTSGGTYTANLTPAGRAQVGAGIEAGFVH